MGCAGVVIGAGRRRHRRTLVAQWAQVAYPMEVTFHRALDLTADPMESLDILAEAGIDRILTSGCAPTCVEGLEMWAFVELRPKDLRFKQAAACLRQHSAVACGRGAQLPQERREWVRSSVSSELFAMDYQRSSLEEIKRAVQVIKDLY